MISTRQPASPVLQQSQPKSPKQRIWSVASDVSKDLRRYRTAALHNQLKALLKLRSDHAPHALKMETRELASRLTECAVFTAKLIRFIEQTFSEVHQRLTRSLFIPFNLLMVVSLSRMWFCLRYHLLAISKTYHVVRSSLYENAELPHSIADHLGRLYRDYLVKPTTVEERKAGREGLGVEETAPSANELIIRDMGVPVALNEEQLATRQQDFVHPPKLPSTQMDHSATPSKRAVISPCYMDGPCESLDSGLKDWKRRGGRGHGTKRANVLLVMVKKRGKVFKLRARSSKLISRLGKGRVAHTFVAKRIRIGGKLPWGLVHWYSLQLYATAPSQVRRKVHLHKRGMLKHGVHGSDNSEQDGLMATGHKSVQALQRKFTLEMEAAETGRNAETNNGVQNIDAETNASSNVQLGSGTAADGIATSHKIPSTSHLMNHDDIEEIFSMLGGLQ